MPATQGSKLSKKIQLQFCDHIPKFSCHLGAFSCRIFALHFLVSCLAKQNMSPQYLCVKELLKMANDQKNATVSVLTPCVKEVTWQLTYATIKVSSDWKKIHGKKQNNFVIFLYFIKVAANWQLVTLLFQKSRDENKLQICNFSGYLSRKGK